MSSWLRPVSLLVLLILSACEFLKATKGNQAHACNSQWKADFFWQMKAALMSFIYAFWLLWREVKEKTQVLVTSRIYTSGPERKKQQSSKALQGR